MGSIGRAAFSDLLLRASPGLETSYQTGSRNALLAAIAAGDLDIAVYPGDPASNANTALLCEDRLVAALRPGHPLARAGALRLEDLRRATMLLPGEGDDADFRRLVQSLLPGLGVVGEAPAPALIKRLAASDAIAIVANGQRDELGRGIAISDIAGSAAAFPVQLTWSPAVAHLQLGALTATRA